jgi:hypothetical protein
LPILPAALADLDIELLDVVVPLGGYLPPATGFSYLKRC